MAMGCWECANDTDGICVFHDDWRQWFVPSNNVTVYVAPSWECCRCGVVNAPAVAQCNCSGEEE